MRVNCSIKWFIPLVLVLVSALLYLVAHNIPSFASWYAAHLFPILRNTVGVFLGLIPISIHEIGLLAIISIVLWRLGVTVAKLFTTVGRQRLKEDLWRKTKGALLILSYAISICLFLFMLTTGINYNRESFAEHVGIQVTPSSIDELIDLYLILIEQAKEVSDQITTSEEGLFVIDKHNLDMHTREAMINLDNMYGGLGSPFPRLKTLSFVNAIFANLNIGGFYSVITTEVHFIDDSFMRSIPFNVLHERAHAAGYMQEDEANFIAYLAGWHSGNSDLMYSSVCQSIIYVLNKTQPVVSAKEYQELFRLLPPQVRRDLAAKRQPSQREFDRKILETSNKVYDTYLRLNRQNNGIMSYGQMVDLMLAYYIDCKKE